MAALNCRSSVASYSASFIYSCKRQSRDAGYETRSTVGFFTLLYSSSIFDDLHM